MGPKITTITGQDGYAQIGMDLGGLPQVVDVWAPRHPYAGKMEKSLEQN